MASFSTTAFAALSLALLVPLSGCTSLDKELPTFPPLENVANFLGDWSLVPGNFSVFRVYAHITRSNYPSGDADPYPASCKVPYRYELDQTNRTILISQHNALDPINPGRLRVLLLNEFRYGDQPCLWHGPFAVNENAPSPPVCLGGETAEQMRILTPWRCHLPLEPMNDVAHGIVWTNVTFVLDSAAPGGFRGTVNGHPVDGATKANATQRIIDEAKGKRYDVQYELEALGSWPYASVQRGATGGGRRACANDQGAQVAHVRVEVRSEQEDADPPNELVVRTTGRRDDSRVPFCGALTLLLEEQRADAYTFVGEWTRHVSGLDFATWNAPGPVLDWPIDDAALREGATYRATIRATLDANGQTFTDAATATYVRG